MSPLGASLARDVAKVLNDCARSNSAHKASAKLLWQMHRQHPEAFLDALIQFTNHTLVVFKGDPSIDRVIRFLITFATSLPKGSEEPAMECVEAFMSHLLSLSTAIDKSVRIRVCQLLAGIFNNLPEDAELTGELADGLQESMLERIQDKIPQVRSYAARSLARLANPGENGECHDDPVTDTLMRTLEIDKNKDVRKCIILSLYVCQKTFTVLLARTKDVSEDVRRTVFQVVAEKLPMSTISKEHRMALLENGLCDRSSSVSKAAVAMLQLWLSRDCGSDPLALLQLLDTTADEAGASAALKALLDEGHIDALKLANKTCDGPFLKIGTPVEILASGEKLSPDAALFWRVVCEWLSSSAQQCGSEAAITFGTAATIKANAASEYLEALDNILPDSVAEFMEICDQHISDSDQHRAISQLVLTAAHCMDFTDGHSRHAAEQMIRCTMWRVGDDSAHLLWEAVEELAASILPNPKDHASFFMDIVIKMAEEWGLQAARHVATEAENQEILQCQFLLRALVMLLRHWPVQDRVTRDFPPQLISDIQHVVPELILNAIQHPKDVVRQDAVKALGLYCMISSGTPLRTEHMIAQLVESMHEDSISVRSEAARSLCDILSVCGSQLKVGPIVTESGDQLSNSVVEHFLAILNSAIGDSPNKAQGSAELCTVVAEGVAKLLVQHNMPGFASILTDTQAVRFTVTLIMIFFSPSTENMTHLRQCLAVALDALPRMSSGHHQLLAQAFLPTARQAVLMCPNQRSTASRNITSSVIRYMTQLLQTPVQSLSGEDTAHEQLVENILLELQSLPSGPSNRHFKAGLCKALNAIPIQRLEPTIVKRLYHFGKHVSNRAELDSASLKDVAAFTSRLEQLDCFPSDPLADDEMDALLTAMEMHREDGDFREFIEAASAQDAPKRRPATQRRRQNLSSSGASDNASHETGGGETIRRQQPMRKARVSALPLPRDVSSDSSSDNSEGLDDVSASNVHNMASSSEDESAEFQSPANHRSRRLRSNGSVASDERNRTSKADREPLKVLMNQPTEA